MKAAADSVLLITKIARPVPRGQALSRSALLHSLGAGLRRLTAICAPAGSGKTTLLGQWAAASDKPAAWVSLDERDNDLIRFWRYVAYAWDHALSSGILERVLPLLQNFPFVSITTTIDVLINELYAAGREGSLVLDDYHAIRNDAIHESLSYFLTYMPAGFRLLIASRNELPFASDKVRLADELIAVGAAELRFTLEETAAFYKEVAGLPLSPDHVRRLAEATEGWAAGLQLSSISMRSRTDYDRFIEQFSGDHRPVADYLFHEVFDGLSADMRDFLLQTSILTRMNSQLCDALTGREDSRTVLDELRSRNLFVVPLDESQHWLRYHHLFAEFLQSRIRQGDPARLAALHRLAGQCFARAGLLDEAIEHALSAGEEGLSAQLLEGHIFNVLQRGEFATLLRWFERLGEIGAEVSPHLALLHAFLRIVTGHFDRAAQELEAIERSVSALSPSTERDEWVSGLFFVKANYAFTTGDYATWIEYADKITESIPRNPVFYNLNYNTNEPFVRRTAFGLKGSLFPDLEELTRTIIGILRKHGWQDSLFYHYIIQSLIEGYYEWNRIAECEELLPETERMARGNRIAGLFVPNRLACARVLFARGEADAADEAIDEAIRFVQQIGEQRWLSTLRAFRARLLLQWGRNAEAKELIGMLGIAASDRPTFHKHTEYAVLARLLGEERRYGEAQRLLEILKSQGQREQCLVSIVEVSVQQALLESGRGNAPAAYGYLEEALEIGQGNGYVRSFVDEGPGMRRLLERYAALERSAPYAAYIDGLLAAFPAETEPRPFVLPDPLTPKELEVLLWLGRGATNRDIAMALDLKVGSVKVYLNRIFGKLGVSSRTQALLKAQELGLLARERD
ncbi:LuxR C-terminal-related transcriptional regulator [Paenibacillus hodogayensis]|uniref:LuxR C-terminal-related transcriptional regulator n=1 Tax=Paenibacillus hodogayensis TaxID=279208 RepID=A0ABV5VWI7_9BACL